MGHNGLGTLALGFLLLLFLTATLAVICYPILVATVTEIPKLCLRRRFIYCIGLSGFFAGGAHRLLAMHGWLDHPFNA